MRRDEKNSLGISIVGGKVDLSWSGSSVTGIFIKNVLPDSPAGKSGLLKVSVLWGLGLLTSYVS